MFPRPADGRLGRHLLPQRHHLLRHAHDAAACSTQFHHALAPGGYLFLGYSESLFRLFEGFELTEVAGAFLYRRPETPRRATPLPGAAPRIRPVMPLPSAPPVVRHVARPPPGRPAARSPTPAPRARRGRSRRSRRRSTSTPRSRCSRTGASARRASCSSGCSRRAGEDLAVRLTLANLYGILRQADRARECYVAALQLEPLSAEAHLFFGIHLLADGRGRSRRRSSSRARSSSTPTSRSPTTGSGRCREAQRDVAPRPARVPERARRARAPPGREAPGVPGLLSGHPRGRRRVRARRASTRSPRCEETDGREEAHPAPRRLDDHARDGEGRARGPRLQGGDRLEPARVPGAARPLPARDHPHRPHDAGHLGQGHRAGC